MNNICGAKPFDLIEKYKNLLVEATNIETSPEEMQVIDTILLRFWQMGWLDKLEKPAPKRGKWEEVNQIIDQSEYELLDGIGMPYHARTFSAEEYETIKGVVEYIRKAFKSEE